MDYRRIFTERILPLKSSLFRYGYSFLKDRQKAEDAVQEAMLRLWNRRESWNELENLEGYSLGIVRHLCLDELRKNKIATSELDLANGFEGNDHSPLDTVTKKEISARISKAVLMLPEKQQHCFHLRETEGKAYDEIAGILGMSMEQVKVTLFRARSFVKDQLLKQEAYGLF